ncbi:MAG: sugar transferase [Beijerinckiaceae bacterium]|nr:sugar transferase [Beijerinckiaceae bacterium]
MPRILELSLALLGMFILSPIAVVIVFLVRATSPGHALFKQIRVGRGQKPFTIYKIRTMQLGTIEVGTHLVEAQSVTSIGRILRKLRLDEIPQLMNVIAGDMSLVGPRPCLPSQMELIAARQAENVYTVRPGITGLAQIQGLDMSNPLELAKVDGAYVRDRSIVLDLRIIFQTITGRAIDTRPNVHAK